MAALRRRYPPDLVQAQLAYMEVRVGVRVVGLEQRRKPRVPVSTPGKQLRNPRAPPSHLHHHLHLHPRSHTQGLTLRRQAQLFSGTSLVVHAHGAVLGNYFFLPAQAAALQLSHLPGVISVDKYTQPLVGGAVPWQDWRVCRSALCRCGPLPAQQPWEGLPGLHAPPFATDRAATCAPHSLLISISPCTTLAPRPTEA